MLDNLKTSTQIGIKFTIYTIIQIIIFAFFANGVFFYRWYDFESKRLEGKVSRQFPLEDLSQFTGSDLSKGKPPINEFFNRKIKVIDNTDPEYNLIQGSVLISNISYYNNNYYLLKSINNQLFITDINPHISMQLNLIYISLFLLFVISLITYLFSTSFALNSLKKLNNINKFLDGLNLDNLNTKIQIIGNKDDEINKLAIKFNHLLSKLENQAQGLKDFIKNASHELKTPLMVINSEIDYTLKSQDYEQGLSNIKNHIKSINNLIEILIQISQIESNNNIDKHLINISTETNEIINNFYSIYSSKNIKLELYCDNEVIIHSVPDSWKIILKNMLDNAIKFTDNGGKITLTLTSQSFVISDNGIGIDQNDLEKIRERFWQGDRSNTDTYSFGLGLHLVRLLIDKNHWTINVDSTKGKGTTFTIYFK